MTVSNEVSNIHYTLSDEKSAQSKIYNERKRCDSIQRNHIPPSRRRLRRGRVEYPLILAVFTVALRRVCLI